MRKSRRFVRFASVLAILAAVFGGALVTASPALAVTCSGSGCNGVDPIASGCSSGAYTVGSPQPIGNSGRAYFELRYSPTCGTNWTRVTSNVGVIHLTAQIRRTSDGYKQNEDGNYQVAWTNMVYAPTVTACAYGSAPPDYPFGEICA